MAPESVEKTVKNLCDRDDDDNLRDEAEDCEDIGSRRVTKARRADIEIPVEEVDIRLADKLDSLLRISDTKKPKYFLNKPKQQGNSRLAEQTKKSDTNSLPVLEMCKLKPKNLSKEELRERLLKKYDTLVPELAPRTHLVTQMRILTTKESLDLARDQSKKQLERQMALNSVSGNRNALINGIDTFRMDDDNEGKTEQITSCSKE